MGEWGVQLTAFTCHIQEKRLCHGQTIEWTTSKQTTNIFAFFIIRHIVTNIRSINADSVCVYCKYGILMNLLTQKKKNQEILHNWELDVKQHGMVVWIVILAMANSFSAVWIILNWNLLQNYQKKKQQIKTKETRALLFLFCTFSRISFRLRFSAVFVSIFNRSESVLSVNNVYPFN